MKGKWGTGCLLFGLCLLVALARLHTYHEPTDRDLGGYAVIAHEMLNGKRIFEGVLVDQKPPGIHTTYAIAEMIAGYGRNEIYLLGVSAAMATLIGFYFAGKNIAGSRGAGLWAALFWTVTCSDLWLEANQPNSEVFINAWTVFGILILLGRSQRMAPWLKPVLAGVCFALASFYKHVVVVIPFFMGLAYILFPPAGRTRRQAFYDIAIIGMVGVLAWVGLFSYFGITGRFKGLYDGLVVVNVQYSGDKGSNLVRATSFSRLFPEAIYGLLPLGLLSMGGICTAIYQRKFFPWCVFAGLAVGTGLAVALPGKFFPHYYQLWYPFLILGSALTANRIMQSGSRFKLARLIPMFALIALLANEVPPYFHSAREWSEIKYGPIFVQTDQLANDIRKWIKPGETMFQLGEEPQLYFDTGLRPTSTICIYGVFTGGPLSVYYSQRTCNDLFLHPPDLLVMDKWSYLTFPKDSPLWLWIHAKYALSPSGSDRGMLIVCVRQGSDLQKRLAADLAKTP